MPPPDDERCANQGNRDEGIVTFEVDGRTLTAGLHFPSSMAADAEVNGMRIQNGRATLTYGHCYVGTTDGSGPEGTNYYGASLGIPNDPGAYDVTVPAEMNLADIPSIGFAVPVSDGNLRQDHYYAGFGLFGKCNPCGSGTITVDAIDVATATATGSFDVTAVWYDGGSAEPDPNRTKRITGTFTADFDER